MKAICGVIAILMFTLAFPILIALAAVSIFGAAACACDGAEFDFFVSKSGELVPTSGPMYAVQPAPAKPISAEMMDLLIEPAAAAKPVHHVIDFWAEWCIPCKAMHGTVNRVYKSGLNIQMANIDTHWKLAAKYKVESIPCFVAVDADGNEVGRIVGKCTEAELRALFGVDRSAQASTPDDLLVDAGRSIGVLSITSGNPNPMLQAAAESHAAYQASVQQCGHQNWDARHAQLVSQLPGYEISEIATSTWTYDDRSNVGVPATPEDAAQQMFAGWRTSPGHWRVANWRNALYGYSMACGRNNVWYGNGIIARRAG